jgi:hypothetical protein
MSRVNEEREAKGRPAISPYRKGWRNFLAVDMLDRTYQRTYTVRDF